MRIVAALFLLLAAARADAATYALVIGYNSPPDGQKDLATLRYADDDALRYAAHFESFTDKTWLLSVLDEDTQLRHPHAAERAGTPTWKAIDAALADIKKRLGENDVFYFAYSGHGARDAKGNYFLALKDGGITQQSLYERIVAAVPARYHHLIIDACHAEAIVGSRGMFDKEKNARVKVVEPQFTQQTYRERFQSVGTIVGTTSDNETHEWSKIQGGVFSHAVLSALSGAADVNIDGRIEYSEVHAFVASTTRTFSDPRNRPRIVAMPPRANMHAALLDRERPQAGFILAGMASALGHFFIELKNGQRVLEANITGDMPVRLWIPHGARAYLRTDDREAEIDAENEGEVKITDLRLRPRGQAAKGTLEQDFRTALFAAPFGVSYYKGFVDSAGVASVDFEAKRAETEVAAKPTKLAVEWPAVATEPAAVQKQPAQPKPARWSRRKQGALASILISATFAGFAIASGAAMAQAERDFDATNLQKAGKEAADRYEGFRALTGLCGVVAGTTLVIGVSTWPYSEGASEKVTTRSTTLTFSGTF